MTHRNRKPSRSKAAAAAADSGATRVIGDKSFGELLAEFGELAPDLQAGSPPANSITIAQLCEVWGLKTARTQIRVNNLMAQGKMRAAGRYRINRGHRGLYPVMHYVRVK